MHQLCQNCIAKSVPGACDLHECRNCCKPKYYRQKKRNPGKHIKKNQEKTQEIVRSGRLEPTSLSPEEIIDILENVLHRAAFDEAIFQKRNEINSLCKRIRQEFLRAEDLRAAVNPLDLFSEPGLIVEKAGFRPEGWSKRVENSNNTEKKTDISKKEKED